MPVLIPPADEELRAAGAALGDELRRHAWRVATAESSTGGLIGHALTMIPGASDYYLGGVISYSNRAKQELLGVPSDLLERHGAVSGEVASAMAAGARERFGADVGISVTGIAGPDGGTPAKPVGLHFVAVALPGQPPAVERLDLAYERAGNRAAAALAALELALREASRTAITARA
jgi:PncC family amidohydrolase